MGGTVAVIAPQSLPEKEAPTLDSAVRPCLRIITSTVPRGTFPLATGPSVNRPTLKGRYHSVYTHQEMRAWSRGPLRKAGYG